ncbi:MAG: uroporphyrinogen-III synthase [Actinobacteria bacterium]|nr:MAG: uroporphyrinogen-III synthase [Actinomycetota bacterium]
MRGGLTVVLTRPAERSAKLAGRLESLGFDVVVAPLIELEPIETGPIDLSPYDWVVVTSITGAQELRRRAQGEPARVAVIGKATAEAWGGEVDLVPAVSTQEGLLAELPRPSGRVLFAGAEDARRLLVDELGADFIALYRTRRVRPAKPPEGDLVVLASASAVRAYAELGLSIPAVSIGPETTAAAQEAGVRVVREARTHDLDGLVEAVLAASP